MGRMRAVHLPTLSGSGASRRRSEAWKRTACCGWEGRGLRRCPEPRLFSGYRSRFTPNLMLTRGEEGAQPRFRTTTLYLYAADVASVHATLVANGIAPEAIVY